MKSFAPSRRFSQNFLTDPRTAQRIVDALDIQAGDVVVEIGPGKGVLTERLLRTSARSVVAVDLDARAIAHIRAQDWAATERLRLIQDDILNINLHSFMHEGSRLLVLGNIPYAITTPILFWLFESRAVITRFVLMMQREVAQRCVAGPRSKEYGILAVASWYAAQARLLFSVAPGAFFPRPSITSAVVRFDVRQSDPVSTPFAQFMDFVRASFSQRRKVLLNALASWSQRVLGQSIRDIGKTTHSYDLGRLRAEELTPAQLHEVLVNLLISGKGRHQ
jgi:16S rRNA (adenine1518-N6/adenine1519-N6)-dimethyltransferase